MGQGLRRRPRHADRGGPRRAAAGPAARARRRLPGRRPRGRDGRRVRLLPARQGRRGAVDRHRDARARRRRARRPPAPRLRHRDRDRRRRRGADRGDLRRPGRLGAVAPARLPARPRHRRDQGGQPAGDRLHPRRPRHHRVGRHLRRGRGATRWGSSTPPRRTSPSTARPSRSAPPLDGYAALPEAERRARAAALAPTIRGARLDRPAEVGHFTDADVVLDFLARAEHPRLAALGTSLPRPLPAHQGQAAGARPARRRPGRGVDRPAAASCTRPTARTTGLLRAQRDRRTSRRCAAPTR